MSDEPVVKVARVRDPSYTMPTYLDPESHDIDLMLNPESVTAAKFLRLCVIRVSPTSQSLPMVAKFLGVRLNATSPFVGLQLVECIVFIRMPVSLSVR